MRTTHVSNLPLSDSFSTSSPRACLLHTSFILTYIYHHLLPTHSFSPSTARHHLHLDLPYQPRPPPSPSPSGLHISFPVAVCSHTSGLSSIHICHVTLLTQALPDHLRDFVTPSIRSSQVRHLTSQNPTPAQEHRESLASVPFQPCSAPSHYTCTFSFENPKGVDRNR